MSYLLRHMKRRHATMVCFEHFGWIIHHFGWIIHLEYGLIKNRHTYRYGRITKNDHPNLQLVVDDRVVYATATRHSLGRIYKVQR